MLLDQTNLPPPYTPKSTPDFRTLVEHSPDIIVCIDRDLRYTYVNSTFERITGAASTTILGRTIGEFDLSSTPAQRAERHQRMAHVFATGQKEVFTLAATTPEGEKAFDVHLIPELADDGTVVGVFSMMRDVTAHWQAERALSASEAQVLQQLAEIETVYGAAPVGLCVVDRDLRYIRINEMLASIHGFPVSSHLGRTPREILGPIAADRFEPIFLRVLATGEAVTNLELSAPIDAEHGSRRTWLVSYYPLRNTTGQVTSVNAVVIEISKIKQAEDALRLTNETLENKVRIRTMELEAANSALEAEAIERMETVVALRQSEARYRALLEAIPDGIIRVRRDGLFLHIKEPKDFIALRLPEHLIGHTIQKIFPVALAERFLAYIEEAIVSQQMQQFEYESLPSEQFVREARVMPIDNNEAIIMVRDITEKKRAEATLRTNEERYRTLVELSPDAIYINKSDQLIYVNSAFVRLMGAHDAQQLLGKSPFVIYHPDEHALIHLRSKRLLEEEGALPAIEQRIIRLDGAILNVNVSAALYRDSEGEALQVILHDITERKRNEAALRESEERYRTLVEKSPDAIFINRRNEITYANAACCRLLGATSAAGILGKSPLTFVRPSDHSVAKERIAHLFKGGSVPIIEYQFIRLDGTTIDVEVTSAAIPEQGEFAIQVILHDLSSRKQAEAERRRLLEEVIEQRSQLRSLNQRLTEIQEAERKALARELHDQVGSNLSLLAVNLKRLQNQYTADFPVDALVHTDFKELQSLVQQINQRIHDVMADLWPPVLDDYGLLAALEWYAARLASYSQMKIYVRGAEPEPRLDSLVEQALFRIVQEALTNVVKHANATITTIRLTTTAERLTLALIDNGHGFSAQKDQRSLMGHWGLLNMRERAHAIGGDLQITSRPGEGTSLIVNAPRSLKRVVGDA